MQATLTSFSLAIMAHKHDIKKFYIRNYFPTTVLK